MTTKKPNAAQIEINFVTDILQILSEEFANVSTEMIAYALDKIRGGYSPRDVAIALMIFNGSTKEARDENRG